MNGRIAAICLAVGLAVAPVGSANAAEPVGDSVVLPTDQVSLAKLNDAHLKMVRAAMRECNATPRMANDTPGCVVTYVEQGVSQSNDPQLKAFNAKLPTGVRYDENRTINDVNRVMQPSRQ